MPARTVFVTNKYFAIQDFVIAENVVQHLLIKTILRRRLEGDFHTTGLLVLQVDIPAPALVCCINFVHGEHSRGLFVESNTDCLQFSF